MVDEFRAFNRFYTRRIGAVGGLLGTPYDLPQARVLYELGQRETIPTAELRTLLELDGGYLSRLLARMQSDGLIERTTRPTDARAHDLKLTPAGRTAYDELNTRSAVAMGELLGTLDPLGQTELMHALETVQRLLGDPGRRRDVWVRAPRPGDYGWVVSRHGALYAGEYGWDSTFEALVARIVAEHVEDGDPHREAGWIAEVDGAPAGCVFCTQQSPEVAKLRLLLVEPSARGLGVGSRLVDECIGFARATGYRELVLWTNDVLHAARVIYERAGFRLRRSAPHRAFGHDLVEQDWSLSLL